jgi:biotin--protein ligase
MIYIYSDEGTCKNSIDHMVRALGFCAPGIPITKLYAPELISAAWQRDARFLIVPGGADVPYGAKLNGPGNRVIRAYVAQGGTYIGICAGAYYGARRIEFDKQGVSPIVGLRELGFFPGSILGPHWAAYTPGHHAGARAITIYGEHTEPWDGYINGGGRFVIDSGSENLVTPMAWDKDTALVMVGMRVGKGQVFLSSVHWEYDPCFLLPCCSKITPPCLDDLARACLMASDPTRRHFVHKLWQKIMRNTF